MVHSSFAGLPAQALIGIGSRSAGALMIRPNVVPRPLRAPPELKSKKGPRGEWRVWWEVCKYLCNVSPRDKDTEKCRYDPHGLT